MRFKDFDHYRMRMMFAADGHRPRQNSPEPCLTPKTHHARLRRPGNQQLGGQLAYIDRLSADGPGDPLGVLEQSGRASGCAKSA